MDILIAPKTAKSLIKVTLPRPKDEQPQTFAYDEDNICLYEIVQYKDDFRSWFIDNQLCSDGHYKMLTKIDPLFIFLPQLIKYAKDQYRPLGDICQDFEQSIESNKSLKTAPGTESSNHTTTIDKLDYALSPDIKWDNVCDTQQIDDELFVRFSETKTINWLVKKHARLIEALRKELSDDASKATRISYALDLLTEYIPETIVAKFKDTVKGSLYSDSSSNLPSSAHKQTLTQKATQKLVPNQPSKRVAINSAGGSAARPKPSNGIARFFKK